MTLRPASSSLPRCDGLGISVTIRTYVLFRQVTPPPSRRRDPCYHPGMLELRPNCQCCDRDLPPDCADARICSFECTFCAACADGRLARTCPNCGGELVIRPRRPKATLASHPAS